MSLRIATALLLVASPAHAAMRDLAGDGSRLSVEAPCAKRVVIQPDSSLRGHVAIAATADHQEELDRLAVEQRDGVHLGTQQGRCWRPAGALSFEPTLELAVRVPPGFAIAIDDAGAPGYEIGPVGGPLAVELSGVAHLTAERVTTLAVNVSGSGSVDVARAAGAAQIGLSGGSKVTVREADMPSLSLDLSGAGRVEVASGQVGHATIEGSGATRIRIGATVGNAAVELSGAGSVSLAKVTGALTKDISGVGSVSVGE